MQHGRINEEFVKAAKADPTVGLPLFAAPQKPMPPERIGDSAARIETFKERVKDGSFSKAQGKILALIKTYGPRTPHETMDGKLVRGLTIMDLRDTYHIPINEGSGRCSELERAGYINCIGKKRNPQTKRPISIYQAAN